MGSRPSYDIHVDTSWMWTMNEKELEENDLRSLDEQAIEKRNFFCDH